MALGIVSGSEVDTPAVGVKVNGGAFRSAALQKGDARAGMAEAVGGLFGDVSGQIAQNRRARQVFDADLAMKRTYDQFNESLVNNPDEGTWLPLWEQQSKEARDSILDNPHMGPDTKRLVTQKLDNWYESGRNATNIAALQKGVNESWKSASADAIDYANRGMLNEANQTMDAAVANHAGLSTDAARLKKQFPIMATEANANQAIQRFPIDSPKVLPKLTGWDALPQDKKRTLLHLGTEAMHGAQSANLDSWSEKLDNSPTHTIDEKAFKADLDKGLISQKGYDNVEARMKRLVAEDQKQASLEDRNEALLTMLDITNANAVGSTDPNGQKAQFTDRISGIADRGLRLRATKMLDEKFQAAAKEGKSAEKPVHRDQLDFMKQDFDEGSAFVPMTEGKPATPKYFGLSTTEAEPPKYVAGGIKGIEKMPDNEFKDQFGENAKKSDVIEAARLNYATKQKAYLDWAESEKGQNATPEEAATERKRLEHPDASSAARDQAAKAIPKQISSEEEFNALKPGDPFIFNGRVGTKN